MLASAYFIRRRAALAITLLTSLPLLGPAGCMGLLLSPAAIEDRVVRFHQTVEFIVIDAETAARVPGATVTVGYAGWDGLVPEAVSGLTGADGRVTLRVVKDRNPGASACSDGYLPSVNGKLGADPPESVVLRMYRQPAPFHVLEVPDDYRGELRFRLPILPPGQERGEPHERSDWRPGQRGFVTRLVPGKVVDMTRLPEMGAVVYDHEAIRAARDSRSASVPLWINRQWQGAEPHDDDPVALWHLGSYTHPVEIGGTLYVMYLGRSDEASAAQARLRDQWEGILHPGLYLIPELPVSSGSS